MEIFVCVLYRFFQALDLINRNILFYKLMHGNWRGKVIDTLRDLYNKTSFRVKRNGKMSPSICNNIGVNQGGVASGFLFRKYMADLGRYLDKEVCVCASAKILVHLLWTHDLIYFSVSPSGPRITLPAKNMEYFLFRRLFAFLWDVQGISVFEIHSSEQILLLGELIST